DRILASGILSAASRRRRLWRSCRARDAQNENAAAAAATAVNLVECGLARESGQRRGAARRPSSRRPSWGEVLGQVRGFQGTARGLRGGGKEGVDGSSSSEGFAKALASDRKRARAGPRREDRRRSDAGHRGSSPRRIETW